jgi:hypothetical protein
MMAPRCVALRQDVSSKMINAVELLHLEQILLGRGCAGISRSAVKISIETLD